LIPETSVPVGNGKLRVLQVHNHCAPGWGGEDTVVELEARLLRDRGHSVEVFKAYTADLKEATIFRQMMAVPAFLWSRRAYKTLRKKITEFMPDLVHVHNTFPRMSPSVFWASHRAGLPVVQTLHNYRHICANALLLRDDRRCEECVGRSPLPALRHRCYANSTPRTAVVAAINALHSKLGTYSDAVDAYIVLNEFNREVFQRGHLPGRKLIMKPNFVPVSKLGGGQRKAQAFFAGELSRSKGVELLLEAWSRVELEGFNLLLAGDGPERAGLQGHYARLPGVTWCGRLSRPEVLEQIAASRLLAFPSLAYENCPMVLLEAMSVGTPVVVADHPGLKTIVEHGREGLLFEAGNPRALAAALREALLADDGAWAGWSRTARRTHAERYSEEVNYGQLISIYRAAIRNRSGLAPEGSGSNSSASDGEIGQKIPAMS